MSSTIQPLYELIRHCLICQQRLEPYKISEKQVHEVFVWLDHRRRGYIDVSDFHFKFSELSESQLFYIFKFLDISRKGAFTYQDLKKSLCSKLNYSSQSNGDSIKCFNNLIRVLKATFHLIEQEKRKLQLTPQKVKQIFNRATLKSNVISITDLILLFKEAGLQINQQIVIYLKNKIFLKPSLSQKQFTQIFSQFIWEETTLKQIPSQMKAFNSDVPLVNLQTKTLQKIRTTQKVCSQIDRILQKYKNPMAQNNEKGMILNKKYDQIDGSQLQNHNLYRKIQRRQLQSNIQQVDNKFEKQLQMISDNSIVKKQFNQINKRREELRRGSLQRQKIIDDVINRKKNQGLGCKPGVLYKHNLRVDINDKFRQFQPSSITPNQRPSTPFYNTTKNKFNFDLTSNPRLYENYYQKQNVTRPSSAIKTSSEGFYQKSLYGKLGSQQYSSKPDLLQFYRRNETPKHFVYEKQNILKRAQQQATKKIQQIERRARLKVMEKRTTAGIYNRWFK